MQWVLFVPDFFSSFVETNLIFMSFFSLSSIAVAGRSDLLKPLLLVSGRLEGVRGSLNMP